MFQASEYQSRRQQLVQSTQSSGVILLLGNNEAPKNYVDNTYPFRQDSTFLYYGGHALPNLAMVLDLDQNTTTLFGQETSIDHIIWMGEQPSLQELAQQVGIDNTSPIDELETTIHSYLQQGRKIHFLPPYRGENQILLSRLLKKSIHEIPNLTSTPLVQAVIQQRSIKSAIEIEEMEKALIISDQMHRAVMTQAKPGMKEADLVGILESIATANLGDTAYPAILTINGQILHNHIHHHTLQEGQLVLGDFGAEAASGYASDITRTFPVNAKFSAQQKDIYQLVLDGLEHGITQVKPGTAYKEIHLAVAKLMADGLKALGIMKGDITEAVSLGAHALFFPHGLGHMIGLDVHDMEDLGEDLVGYNDKILRSSQFGFRSLRLGKALEPGYVLTVEPGLYFIPALIHQWKDEGKFKSFINYDALEPYLNFGGIRLEDNVLVTKDGFRVLGPRIPKTIEEVEALRHK